MFSGPERSLQEGLAKGIPEYGRLPVPHATGGIEPAVATRQVRSRTGRSWVQGLEWLIGALLSVAAQPVKRSLLGSAWLPLNQEPPHRQILLYKSPPSVVDLNFNRNGAGLPSVCSWRAGRWELEGGS